MKLHLLIAETREGDRKVEVVMTERQMEEMPDQWADAIGDAREETRRAADGDPFRLLAAKFGVVVLDVPEDEIERAFERCSR